MSRLDELGEVQRTVLEVLWESGEATVQEVRESLGRRKPPAYTTVLSTLQKLEALGWVKHRAEGRTYIYSAARNRRRERKRSLRSIIDTLFGGERELLLEHALEGETLSQDEIERLRGLIDQAEQRERGKKGQGR
ncbi:MAG: BlaI/MecI/CopY family transcriptional regulator [Planctomycetota bacterium]